MNSSKTYRFSVVIPCYNEADYIANTLKSLKAQQTTAKYEVIVVDNNCSDETVKIAKKYGARIITELQPGVCAARQAGAEAAKGEIIISTDADTTFSPSWLANIDKEFSNNLKLVAVGGPCRFFDGPWWGKIYTHFLFGGSYIYSLITGYPFYVTATNFAFKKSVWTGYDLIIMQGGDELDLLHRLRKQGPVRFNNSNPTYTSGRRLSRGLLYNMFVTFLFYYMGAYYIDRIFKRNIIGSAPAFRETRTIEGSLRLSVSLVFVFVVVFSIYMTVEPFRYFVRDNIFDTASIIKETINTTEQDTNTYNL